MPSRGLILAALVVVAVISGSLAEELFFAQSAAFSGPRASFGIELRHGIEAAFFEANDAQILSVNLTLHSLDDKTEKAIAFSNTRDFLANTSISYFALIGETASAGAEGALEARKQSAYPDIPFIGALTGAKFLRNPFIDTVVNVRASFIDEANAIVKFLVGQGKNRISMIFQNDTAGGNAYEGYQIALENSELLPQSVGLYAKGSNESVVKQAVRETFLGHNVQACIIMALASDVALIIDDARRNYGAQNVQFFTLSYNDAAQLFNLTVNQYNQSINNIYATQVVLPPYSDDLPLMRSYRAALGKYFPEVHPTFKSLEGYIVGRFVVEVLDRVRGNISDYHHFYEALYRSQIFFLDGLVLGPYSNSTLSGQCNQGARQVYLTRLHEDGNFTLVPGFEYKWSDACLSSRSSIIESKILSWGQSCDLTGPRSEMGREINLGLLVAFDEANRLNKVPGHKFELITMNDKHEESLAEANTDYLINTRRVMGMVGVTGTGPATKALNFMNNNGSILPFVGAWSGDSKFRTPFQRNVVNTRISFIDEASAMVEWASNQLITHFGMVREASNYGAATQRALETALNSTGLSLRAWSTWDPTNNASIRTACEAVLGGGVPDAVMIAGVDAFAAQAVHECRKTKQGATVKYFYFSTVGAAAIIKELRDVWNDSFENVYFAASYPPAAAADTHPIVQSYKAALESYVPGSTTTLEGLEGYINGRLIVEASSRIRGEITSATFLDSIYGSQLFVIDKEMLGPYADNGVGSNQSCNQGMRRVYLIQLLADGTTPIIPGSDFSWEGTCQSNSENVHLPIVFGQSAPLSGTVAQNGIAYRNGILAAFNRFNRNGGLDGRAIKLNTYDDEYIPEKAVNNTVDLMDSNVVALLGYFGAPMAGPAMEYAKERKVPFIAPYTGAHVFREPCSKYVINMRASYWDEIAAMISFLLDDDKAALRGNRTITKIAAFSQIDPYGPYYSGAVRALAHRKMELSGIGQYQIGTLDVENGLANITAGGEPDAIIVHGTYEPVAKFIKLAQKQFKKKPIFMVLSFVGAVSLAEHLQEDGGVELIDGNNYPTIYIGAAMPSPFDATHPLVAEYLSEMQLMNIHPGYLTLEGYAVGRLVTRALQLAEGEITPRSLTEAIYEKFMFNLNEFYLGPYTLVSTSSSARNRTASQNETMECTCNQGSHQVWLTYIDQSFNVTEIKSFEYIFDTCGVVFEVLINQVLDVGLKGLVLALAVLAIVVVSVCFILVLFYRETKTMTASSPIFLMIILLGAFLLSVSPFFAVQWDLGGATSDNICMTWIWMLGLGFTLFFAPLAVKTYRVYRIFNNRVLSHVITLKDSDLMLYLAVPVAIEIILLIVWTAIAPAKLMTVRIPGTVDQTMQLCTTANAADQPLIIAQAVVFGLIAIAACFFAFRTRNIKYGAFKESTEILFAAYNLTFLSVILVPLHAGLSFYVIPSTIIRTIGVVFQVLVSLGALFGMKLYRIITNNEKMSTTTRHSGYSSRGPLSFSSTSGSSHTKSSKTTTTTSSTTKSSRSTTTTSTTTSSRTSGSTRSSNSSSSTTSSDSDSDSGSSSSSKKKDKKEKKPAAAEPKAAAAAAPKTKALPPGGKITSEIMTEPSDEEPEAAPKRKKNKQQRKNDDHELEEMQHDEPEKPSKSSVLPKWLSPKSKRKGGDGEEKKDKPEIVFVHHDGDEEPATEPSDDEEEHPNDAEKKPLSPKKSRKNKGGAKKE